MKRFCRNFGIGALIGCIPALALGGTSSILAAWAVVAIALFLYGVFPQKGNSKRETGESLDRRDIEVGDISLRESDRKGEAAMGYNINCPGCATDKVAVVDGRIVNHDDPRTGRQCGAANIFVASYVPPASPGSSGHERTDR